MFFLVRFGARWGVSNYCKVGGMIEASMPGGSNSARIKLNPLEVKGGGCRQ